jgi:hypothetical protein
MNQADSVHSTPPTNTPTSGDGKAGRGGGVMADHLVDNACELYCHGIARIETLGPCRRLIFTSPDVSYPGSQTVVIKLIMTAELLATLSYMAAGADQSGGISPALLALETERAN